MNLMDSVWTDGNTMELDNIAVTTNDLNFRGSKPNENS